MEQDFDTVVKKLGDLEHNYAELARNWYDIFVNPEPKDVVLQLLDENGQIITDAQTPNGITIPNRAKDFRLLRIGEGNPEGVVTASLATLYQDVLNGYLYIKTTGTTSNGWTRIPDNTEIREYFRRGAGNPQGIQQGQLGTLYIDTVDGSLWSKTNAGWVNMNNGVQDTRFSHYYYICDDNDQITTTILDDVGGNINPYVYDDGSIINPEP